MIHFDTNALILLPNLIQDGHPAIDAVLAGEPAAASALAWFEFTSGPVSQDEIHLALGFLGETIVAMDAAQAEQAARLYNAIGRKRALRFDALIAAAALQAQARLLTFNVDDFAPFAPHGLRLWQA